LGEEIKRKLREEKLEKMERERKKREMIVCVWGRGGLWLFFHVVTLSQTTKIFVLKNELTKKEIKVWCSYLLFNFPCEISRDEIPKYFQHENTSSMELFHL